MKVACAWLQAFLGYKENTYLAPLFCPLARVHAVARAPSNGRRRTFPRFPPPSSLLKSVQHRRQRGCSGVRARQQLTEKTEIPSSQQSNGRRTDGSVRSNATKDNFIEVHACREIVGVRVSARRKGRGQPYPELPVIKCGVGETAAVLDQRSPR